MTTAATQDPRPVSTTELLTSAKSTLAAVSVTNAATLVLAADATRTGAVFQPTDADIYIGDSGVTATTGILLTAGTPFTDTLTVDAWYGITASGTADCRVLEITA